MDRTVAENTQDIERTCRQRLLINANEHAKQRLKHMNQLCLSVFIGD